MDKKIIHKRIQGYLIDLYGKDTAGDTWNRLKAALKGFEDQFPQFQEGNPLHTLECLDAILITYGDQIQSPEGTHLQTLAGFIKKFLPGIVSAIHLLPFFPYSSDDGFSVIDYREVEPEIGIWDDLDPLRDCCHLMFDAVINHISSQSAWFQAYLQDQEPYRDYFHTMDPDLDLSQVVRPRAKPLLTEVSTPSGTKYVWTTFSADQIDLNYKNPAVLLEIVDILLYYVQKGAKLIRLDAIAFLWKEVGTSSIHLPQTHQIIKLLRSVLDAVAPGVILISETNVPHEENISYFGEPQTGNRNGGSLGDEAQMVYQFPLAPLVLHTFRAGDASVLTSWASSLETPFRSAAFLNFIASHDGIGVRPAEGLLREDEIQGLVDQTLAHGGQVSYRTKPDGSQSVYELNITLYDALNDPQNTSQDLGNKRFIASQAIMLSLAGVPGIYIHSLFGSPNNIQGLNQTGRARSINREKFQLRELEHKLKDESSRQAKVLKAYTHILKVRKDQPAFTPLAAQQILNIDPRIFSLLRYTDGKDDRILCLINISDQEVELTIDIQGIDPDSSWRDILTDQEFTISPLTLEPYQVLWLKHF
jgi:sucrose phosphorylase